MWLNKGYIAFCGYISANSTINEEWALIRWNRKNNKEMIQCVQLYGKCTQLLNRKGTALGIDTRVALDAISLMNSQCKVMNVKACYLT